MGATRPSTQRTHDERVDAVSIHHTTLSCYTTLLVSYSCVDIDALTARNISSNATSAQPAARRAWPAVCVGCGTAARRAWPAVCVGCGIGCLWSLPLVRELRGSPVCSPKPKRRGPFLLT